MSRNQVLRLIRTVRGQRDPQLGYKDPAFRLQVHLRQCLGVLDWGKAYNVSEAFYEEEWHREEERKAKSA
jgi:hypothetical protein